MNDKELQSKLSGYVSDEDDQYEFIQQNSEFRKKRKEGRLEIAITDNIATDDASMPMCAQNPYHQNELAGCSPIKNTFTTHGFASISPGDSLIQKSPKPHIINAPDNTPYSFDQMLKKMSKSARKTLQEKNLDNQTVLARIDARSIDKLGFQGKDTKVFRNLIVQCRSEEIKNQQKKAKNQTKMPANVITDQLPIKSIITLKALKKQGLLSPVKLYLMTPVSEIQKIFERFPNIPVTDQQNILAGLALARYVKKSL